LSKICQYIDVENFEQLSEKLYQYVINHTNILETKCFWNTLVKDEVLSAIPELEQSLSKVVPAKIVMIAIFYTPPGFAGGIHIDWGPFDYRFLMPVHSCNGSYTKFFDLNGNEVIERYSGPNNTDAYYEVQDKFPMIEIESFETVKPLILNVKTPHGIFTNPNLTSPRLTCTIAFHDEFPLDSLFD
jgi:hypothetical protein